MSPEDLVLSDKTCTGQGAGLRALWSLANLGFAGGEAVSPRMFSKTNPTTSFFRAPALSLVSPFAWILELLSALGKIRIFISLKVKVGFLNVTVQLSH